MTRNWTPAGCPAHAKGATEGASPPAACPAHAEGAREAKAPAKLRIRVDRDLCQGHGVCAGECPEIFAVGRDQKVMVKNTRPGPELHEKVRLAAKHCPTNTIRLEEDVD